jgi:hypothetical protein
MKIQLFILAFFIMPFLAFSQQIITTNPGVKKATKVGVVKKTINTNKAHSQRPTYQYTEEYRIANGVPDDFPRFKNTGNPKQDADNYHQAKQLWIKNNPEKFEKIKAIAL